MPLTRHFLGWDGPLLPRAAAWLAWHVPPRDGAWDLHGVLLATPASRAARRLTEVLVDHAERHGLTLTPPTVTTLGNLPEHLYRAELPAPPPTAAALAWVQVLRSAAPTILAAVTAHPPEGDDLPGWLALAHDLAAAARELAAAGLTFESALGQLQQVPDFPDEARWAALQHLHGDYLATLHAAGWRDRDDARLHAAATGAAAAERRVVLVGAADVPPLTAALLRQAPVAVDVLVHAPPSTAAGFDEVGGLVVPFWRDRALVIDEARLSVVDRPRDAAAEVVRLIGAWGPVAADEVTVGLGDEAQAGAVARAIHLAGGVARAAAGTPLPLTRPLLLLDALRRFQASRRFDDFAALVRHVDVERHVEDAAGVAHWLGLLDRYAGDHLQGTLTGAWLGDAATAAPMQRVYEAVAALLPGAGDEQRPLAQWAAPLAAALVRVYGRRPLQRHDDDDRPVIVALEHVGDVLREWAAVTAPWDSVARATAADALAMLLHVVRGAAVPPEGGQPAVELLGWLELPLDDAPRLIVTGLNEGLIPASTHGDALLPDAARTHLRLTDNARRLAREALLLETILHSRPHVHLIACRHDEEGQVTPPSRLLLRGDTAQRAARLLRFYGEQPAAPPPPPLLAHGVSTFVIPPPPRGPHPLAGLSVTAFRDYLACPYRFYLRHVLGLTRIDDTATEMGGDLFGQLAHDALQALGRDADVAGSTDAARVGRFLDDTLRRAAREKFGDHPTAAVAIQVRRMGLRLRRFARWHTEQVAAGWRVAPRHVERDRKAVLSVDGAPFELRGRIDRVDVHGEHGYRVIDYKTADRGADPQADHCSGTGAERRWVSLQLPLYRVLLRGGGLEGACELGYVRLPRDPAVEPFAAAQWTEDDLAEAEEVALAVIRGIRAGVFWPPGEASGRDGLEGICMDEVFDRAEALLRARRRYEAGGAP